MPAALHNFFVEQGSNFFITFQYLDSNSNPIDISRYGCIRLALRDAADPSKIGLYSSKVVGAQYRLRAVPGSVGLIEWALPFSETRLFDFDSAVYDLELVDDNNERIRICTGTIQIVKNNFPECVSDLAQGYCKSCDNITASDGYVPSVTVTVSPGDTGDGTEPGTTPTPTPTPTIPANLQQEELCDYLCKGIDLFGKLYNYSTNIVYISGANSGVFVAESGQSLFSPVQYVPGTLDLYLNGTILTPAQFTATDGNSINLVDVNIIDEDLLTWINKGLVVNDVSSTTGTMFIADTGSIRNVEVTISNLKHSNPQDLSMILVPPSGDAVLLSAYNKINNYSYTSGLNYTFSNKAVPDIYLNNRSVNDLYINILDKTNDYNSNEFFIVGSSLTADLSDLNGISASGYWSLIVRDHDLGGSGMIDGWNLILTYDPTPFVSEE